jgi:hypothetical protein
VYVAGAPLGRGTDESGVLVMNPVRTRSLRWSEIECFSIGAHGLSTRTGIVHLRDGSTVAMWGIQGADTVARRPADRSGHRDGQQETWNRSAEREVMRLNALLESATTAG